MLVFDDFVDIEIFESGYCGCFLELDYLFVINFVIVLALNIGS